MDTIKIKRGGMTFNAVMVDKIYDYQGEPIEVGSTVAYNRSGEVRIGTVVQLKPNRTNTRYDYDLRAWVVYPYIMVRESQNSKDVSKVNRTESVVVIDNYGVVVVDN